MTYSVTEKQGVWQKVGDRDVKIAEFTNSVMISDVFALLFNDPLDRKTIKLIRSFLDLWEDKTKSEGVGKEFLDKMVETQNREPNAMERELARGIGERKGNSPLVHEKPKKEADAG